MVYRPHPLSRRTNAVTIPDGATLDGSETLEQALDGAALCVTYNSTAGVEAVLSGCPTVTMDRGSMAWPVTAHMIADGIEPPLPRARLDWCRDMAWTTWRMDELADGSAAERLLACRVPAGLSDAA